MYKLYKTNVQSWCIPIQFVKSVFPDIICIMHLFGTIMQTVINVDIIFVD
jgi:hypothetical protein